jgi:hypothetical protein
MRNKEIFYLTDVLRTDTFNNVCAELDKPVWQFGRVTNPDVWDEDSTVFWQAEFSLNHLISEVAFFEIPSRSERRFSGSSHVFKPNTYVDITNYLGTKIQALECYKFEMRIAPHPRSYEIVKVLANWRGSNVGLEFAEAFELGRSIY